MELPNQFWEMTEHLMEVVWTGTGFPVVVYDHEGIIVHATDPTRMGDLHAGAQKIMQGMVDEYAVSPEEAAHNPLVREGYNCPIEIDGRRVAAFGITGELDRTKPLARVAVKLLDAWIADQKHKAKLEASEQKYFKVFNNSPVWVVLSSLNTGRYIEVNETFLRTTGYSREEVIGRTSEEIDTWVNHDERQNLKDDLQEKGAVRNVEVSRRSRDGRMLKMLFSAEIIDVAGEACMLSVSQDISARIRGEERLRLSENNLRITLDSIGDAVIATDTRGRITRLNPMAEKLTGWTAAEAEGRPLQEVFHIVNADTRRPTANPAEEVLLKGEIVGLGNHTILISRAGSEYQIADSGAPIRGADGQIVGVVLVFRDVTEAYLLERKVRKHEILLKGLTANIPGVVYQFYVTPEHDYGLHYVSEKAAEIFGLNGPLEDFFPSFLNGIPQDEQRQFLTSIRRAAETVSPWHYDGRFIKANGDTIWFSGNAIPHREGSEIVFDGVLMDISAMKAAQEEILKRRQFLESVLYHAPDAIITLDADNRVIDWNPGAVQLFGYTPEEVSGRPLEELVAGGANTQEVDRNTRRILSGNRLEAYETVRYRKDGTPIHVIASGSPILMNDRLSGAVAVYTDITRQKTIEQERKGYEARIQQMQKMEAIGMLAGGIAHDFNNILSAVIGYAELALIDTDEDLRTHHNIRQIHAAAMRARELVKQILTFSRQDEKELKPLQIGLQVKEALKMLRSSLPATIEIQARIDTGMDNVMADPTQIHQIVMNLCTNAAQAMEEKGGRLTVRLSQEALTEADVRRHPGLSPGTYVRLSVQDTGSGIGPHILDKIYQPYFTTKEKGKGTGLGLAVVHGIVQNYGGDIRVDTTPGSGTRFDIYLPTIKRAVEPSPPKNEMPKGRERILLVDDEAVIVDIGCQSLERLGYRVDGFTSSVEALERFSRNPHHYDLIITDMTMPKVTGDRLAVEILKQRPDIPIILCTGYSSRIDSRQAEAMGIRAMLMKPLNLSDLACTVRRVLDERMAGAFFCTPSSGPLRSGPDESHGAK